MSNTLGRASRATSNDAVGEGDMPSGNGAIVLSNGAAEEAQYSAALAKFIEMHGLDDELASELTSLFDETVKKAKAGGSGAKNPGVTYRWDQIHEIIVSSSKDTSLVIVNLPDPPDLGGHNDDGTQRKGATMAEQLDYMNYMEGVAANLPRVMYVHGSGQEIINFDRME